MDKSGIFLSKDEIAEVSVGEGVVRQILGYDKDLMLVKVSFEEGSVGDMHSHPHIQSSYIESGKFEMTIGRDVKILEKGDAFFVPSGVRHGLVCLESGAVIDCFSPAREDFI